MTKINDQFENTEIKLQKNTKTSMCEDVDLITFIRNISSMHPPIPTKSMALERESNFIWIRLVVKFQILTGKILNLTLLWDNCVFIETNDIESDIASKDQKIEASAEGMLSDMYLVRWNIS